MSDFGESIPWSSGRYLLGVDRMDRVHAEFATLVNDAATASDQHFPANFSRLVDHAGDHFAQEEVLMAESGFAALNEHRNEHERVLSELRHLAQRVRDGRLSLARSYVRDRLPDWFAVHAATMDSALAAHLKVGTNLDDWLNGWR